MAYVSSRGSMFGRPDYIAIRPRPKIDPWRDYEILEKWCPDCSWDECKRPRYFDMPVCREHAWLIHERHQRVERARRRRELLEQGPPTPFGNSMVYYLMLGPRRVKIGYALRLKERLASLRMDPQYVVALERGARDLERQRHAEFAAERIDGRKEDFELSDRLIAHVTDLQPMRDELMQIALNPLLHPPQR